MADVTIRRIPGHIWVRLFVKRGVQSGHGWMYRGIVRRDAWHIGPVGFGIIRLPRGEKHWVTNDPA